MKSLLLFVLLCSTYGLAQNVDDSRWDTRFGVPGITFPIMIANTNTGRCMALCGDYVVVGGRFVTPGNNIALWNTKTRQWELVGKGIWRTVTDATKPEQLAHVDGMYADGDSVFVWGYFDSVDGKPANNFAVLHPATKTWSVDAQFKGSIKAMTRYGSDIIAAGTFSSGATSIKSIAAYRNAKWYPFGGDSLSGQVTSMCVFKDTLCIATSLSNSTEVRAWAASAWSVFCVMPNSSSFQQNISIASTSSYLFAYGNLSAVQFGPLTIASNVGVLRYNGSTWTNPATRSDMSVASGQYVRGLAARGDDLYLCGDFGSIDGVLAQHVAFKSGAQKQWLSLGSGVSGGTAMQAISLLATPNELYCIGNFDEAGSDHVNNIATYSFQQNQWSSLSGGNTNGLDDASHVDQDSAGILAVGAFSKVGKSSLNYLGLWNGTSWNSLGSGIVGGAGVVDPSIHGIMRPIGLICSERFHNRLVLAGNYDYILGDTCRNTVYYNQSSTECLDQGLSVSNIFIAGSQLSPSVRSMVSTDKGLIVAGDFGWASQTRCPGIARWDGSHWQSLSNIKNLGLASSFDYLYLRVAYDSTHSLLFTGGFNSIDSLSVRGIARWDGNTWSAFPFKDDDTVSISAVCVTSDGRICASGLMTNKSDTLVYGPAIWTGSTWQSLGFLVGTQPTVAAMAAHKNLLYIAGRFDSVASIAARNVAVYNFDTKRWSALGSGICAVEYTKIFEYGMGLSPNSIAFLGDTVIFGGNFFFAGGQPSYNIAAWLPAKANSIEQENTTPQSDDMRLQPNPAGNTSDLHFSIHHSQNIHLSVVDALGRELILIHNGAIEEGEYHSQLDLSALTSGMYYVLLHGAEERKSVLLSVTR